MNSLMAPPHALRHLLVRPRPARRPRARRHALHPLPAAPYAMFIGWERPKEASAPGTFSSRLHAVTCRVHAVPVPMASVKHQAKGV